MIDTPKDQQKTTSPAAKGGSINPHAESSLPPPIFQTATFTFGSAAELAAFHGGENDGYFYSRYGNPTVAAAARRLSRLEGAEASILYASGMAAVSSAFLALLGSGARLVLLGETYRHTKDFAESVLARYGVIVEILEDNSPEALDRKSVV